MNLFTKNGRPLEVSGDFIYSRSGIPVGKLRENKVFGPDGRYVGTIVGDRLVFRSTDSACMGSTFSIASHAGSARADAAGSALWGDEPRIPD